MTPAQLHELQQNMLYEASDERPLISPLSSLNVLREEYEGGSLSFVKKIDWLQKEKGFKGIRRARGDGDCFYRCQFLSASVISKTDILLQLWRFLTLNES